MKRAQKLGAKVITFDADSAPDARPFLVNMATTDSVGRFGAKRLAEELGDKGKVAIVSAQPTAANQNAWIAAFRDEIARSIRTSASRSSTRSTATTTSRRPSTRRSR